MTQLLILHKKRVQLLLGPKSLSSLTWGFTHWTIIFTICLIIVAVPKGKEIRIRQSCVRTLLFARVPLFLTSLGLNKIQLVENFTLWLKRRQH
jgi:hypothetical protein